MSQAEAEMEVIRSDSEVDSDDSSQDMSVTQPAVDPTQPHETTVLSKKRKRVCKWQSDWMRYGMKKSKRGESFAHCNVCNSEVSIASAGISDLKKHMKSKKHCELSLLHNDASQTKITSSFNKDHLLDQITAAEVYFTLFVAEHNIPFLAADHFTRLCKSMFPDSKIAQGYAAC